MFELFAIGLAWFFIIWLSIGILLLGRILIAKGTGILGPPDWEVVVSVTSAIVLWPWFLVFLFEADEEVYNKAYYIYVKRFEQDPPLTIKRVLTYKKQIEFWKFIFARRS